MTTNVNAVTRYLSMCQEQNLMRDIGSTSSATSAFLEAMITRRTEVAAGASKNVAVENHAQMDMEEYKNYIHDAISQIPLNPSRALSNISITISDAGFEAMKNDPEYEKWVLDSIKENFSMSNPWVNVCGGGYETHFFGATKESYHGESWYPGYQGGIGDQLFHEKSEKSFWEKRVESQKKFMELTKKRQEKEQLIKAQEMRAILLHSDKEKMPYLSGVPASELLSMLV